MRTVNIPFELLVRMDFLHEWQMFEIVIDYYGKDSEELKEFRSVLAEYRESKARKLLKR